MFPDMHHSFLNEEGERMEGNKGGVSGLLLEYEKQVANPLRSMTLTAEWMEKAEGIVSSEFLNVLRTECRNSE